MAAAPKFVENVTIEDLKTGLADGSITLIDVREPNEYGAGHIPGAVLNPLQKFDIKALPEPQAGKRIVLACQAGGRSLTALSLVQSSGREDIKAHYPGGFSTWAKLGEPVEK